MYKNVICVGTIWDLDDAVYPELDNYSGMSRWNYYQVMKHQLSSSRKEMKNVVKLPLFPRNQYGIRVRACCASCVFKEISQGGKRICTYHHIKVEALEKCKCWLMSASLQNVGRNEQVKR